MTIFGYKLIFEFVWSNNLLLIPGSMIKYRNTKYSKIWYSIGHTNRYKNYTYRLRPRFVKKEELLTNLDKIRIRNEKNKS